MTDRQLTILAALNLMVAVGAGAFGAHGLKRIVSPSCSPSGRRACCTI